MRSFSSREMRQFLWRFVLTFLLYLSYFAEGRSYVEINFGQYAVGFMDGAIVSISCVVLTLYLTEGEKDEKGEVGFIEGVSAYLFFPSGVPREQRTLDYHRKHLRHRLIMNLNTEPPEAYYLPLNSYGWKFIEKFSGAWISEVVDAPGYSIDDPGFTEKWCEEKGYQLISRTASKKDLLKSG